MLDIEIDSSSGFCFGVIHAIRKAEEHLKDAGSLNCLGDIVHNGEEVRRLSSEGLTTIDYAKLEKLRDSEVLFRAHGEPPQVYELARKNNVKVVDATCPVVINLQRKIHRRYLESRDEGAQIVIYGKPGHAEVNGLVGQTDGNAIVVQSVEDLDRLDYSLPIILFSQTTMNHADYSALVRNISERISPTAYLESHDTICRQVANRAEDIADFAASKDWIYFVAGKKSSNGQVLYGHCKEANPHTVFVSSADEISQPLPSWVRTVGICGATSTPMWQMEQVRDKIFEVNPSH